MKGEGAREGEEPRPWLLYTLRKHGVFEEMHGHAYYPRGPHCFEVHAWLTDRTPRAAEDLRAALDALTPGEDPGCGLKAPRVARLRGKDPLEPPVLLEAAQQYLPENPALAAGLARRARALGKPGALTAEELLVGGQALLAAGAPAEAAPWFRDAEGRAGERSGEKAPTEEELAKARERARLGAYHLARACGATGQLDEAFAALDRAFAEGLLVTKLRLSNEKELAPLRADPRWEAFWRLRVEGK